MSREQDRARITAMVDKLRAAVQLNEARARDGLESCFREALQGAQRVGYDLGYADGKEDFNEESDP